HTGGEVVSAATGTPGGHQSSRSKSVRRLRPHVARKGDQRRRLTYADAVRLCDRRQYVSARPRPPCIRGPSPVPKSRTHLSRHRTRTPRGKNHSTPRALVAAIESA